MARVLSESETTGPAPTQAYIRELKKRKVARMKVFVQFLGGAGHQPFTENFHSSPTDTY